MAAYQLHCAACHLSDKVVVGPHFVHIQEFYPLSKRKEFIDWCVSPGKRNPEMPQMPSVAHVAVEDLEKIHDYILSVQVKRLKKKSNKDPFPDTRRPRIVRTFLPDCSPASILVALPSEKKLNFVWDTVYCRLRYVTEGEPNNYPYLKSNGNSLADPGKQVYTESSLFATASESRYLGYKIKGGLPVFIYEVSGNKIEESITHSTNGFVRTLRSKTQLPELKHQFKKGNKLKTLVTKKGDNFLKITHTLQNDDE